jgi:hypothetical protein
MAVARLRPGGLVVDWRIRGLPVRSFDALPGHVTHVSGRVAKLSVRRPGTCPALGADVTVDVVVMPPPGSATVYEFLGCARAPSTDLLLTRMLRILHSTSLPQ